MTTEYNGRTNYETWLVNRHFTNDQSEYDFWIETAREVLTDAKEAGIDSEITGGVICHLAQLMRENVEGLAEESTLPSMLRDMLTAAVSEVEWREVAESILTTALEIELSECA